MTVALVLHRAGGAPVSTSFRGAAFGKDDPACTDGTCCRGSRTRLSTWLGATEA